MALEYINGALILDIMRKLFTLVNVIINAKLKSAGAGPGITLKLNNLNFPHRIGMSETEEGRCSVSVQLSVSLTRQMNWTMK